MKSLLLTCRVVPLCLLAATTVVSSGCNKKEPPQNTETNEASPPTDPGLDFVPTEHDRTAMDALVEQINDKTRRFPYRESSKKDNAKLFTYLAATSEDPNVVAAALQAIQSSYSHRSAQKQTPDADLDRVLLKQLSSKQPLILGRALMASRVVLMGPEPNPHLVEAILKLGSEHESGPGRYAIVDALSVLRPSKEDPAVTKLLLSSLQDNEPYVLSAALQGLQRRLPEPDARAELRRRLLELSNHPDPGVRGRALRVLSMLGSSNAPEILDRVRAALSDEHAYVRAESCEAIAHLGHKPSIHDLMKLIEEQERSVYDLKGWTLLEGRPGTVRHRIPARTLVGESAVHAVSQLSDGELKLERGDRRQPKPTLAKNVEGAKAWYAKARGKIPQPPAAPTSQASTNSPKGSKLTF